MSPVDRIARRIVLAILSRTRAGELEIVECGQRMVFGELLPERPLRAVVHVHDARFYRDLLRGSVGLGESYMDGVWDCEDLVVMTRIAALNVGALDRLRRVLWPVLIPVQRWVRWLVRNTPVRSRRRIEAHYDLGNELFELFLDPTMMYSCAVFDSPAATLEEASLAKLERVCSKLDLRPQDHVLEIGTGWGGFALYAAERYGCRVTTTTISREQHAHATRRVREAGLQSRVTVLLQDYRDRLEIGRHGPYDKLVCIEMIEAVGWQYFPTFFRRCSELVRDDGAMLLQAITIDDRAYEVEKASKSFIKEYIFPGGCLPSMEIMTRHVARQTDLQTVGLQDITDSYVETLRRWRANFAAHADDLAAMGYDESFQRLWTLYLAYCEGGFAERRICDVQLLLAKPQWAVKAHRHHSAAVAAAATG
jgi:cyclopropane-fatty-acyl-phospholipid synthase